MLAPVPGARDREGVCRRVVVRCGWWAWRQDFVVLLEFRAWFALGVVVKNDTAFEVDVPAAVEGDLCAKVLDLEITGLLDFRCDNAWRQGICRHGDSLLWHPTR